jgi:biopolymer transport protein TolR
MKPITPAIRSKDAARLPSEPRFSVVQPVYVTMRKSKYSTVSEINVTSLVDVTMVLLIIFMLTAPFIQAGIKVKLPKARSTVIKETDAVVISVDKQGKIFINNEAVEDAQLGDALKTLKVAGEESVFVRADENVPYGVVMKVIGEVKGAGINNVGMITELKEK